MRKMICLVLCFIMLVSAAYAELFALPAAQEASASDQIKDDAVVEIDAMLTDGGLDLGIHSIHYPVLTGMADEALQTALNERILNTGNVTALLSRLPVLMSSAEPLTAVWSGTAVNGILSVVMSACGPVYDTRFTHVWSTVNAWLSNGSTITMKDLFTDEKEAVEVIRTYMNEQVAPELSGYLENDALEPLPECWYISDTGITFCYPIAQLSTLSSRAGTVTVLWSELSDLLLLGEGSVLRQIGAEQMLTLDETSPARIAVCVSEGRLPGIPVALGASMQTATDTYKLLTDADLFAGGRLFALEDGAFRGTLLITDDLSRTWTDSVVQGIRCDRIAFYGLITGLTTIQDWRETLGTPDASVTLTEDQAGQWRLPAGTSDYYQYGEHRLRLHADTDGVLASVFLLP